MPLAAKLLKNGIGVKWGQRPHFRSLNFAANFPQHDFRRAKEGSEVDFTYLRNLLDVTDGNLGAHLHKLEEAGYIAVQKTFVERKPRTFVTVTAEGRQVFREHVAALEVILKGK
ncbi:MAG TPA: transcriptional regulator [Phototrophicaceae bacterium]|nr:transcriptional regulator [Phototrophicaceae bacterium]